MEKKEKTIEVKEKVEKISEEHLKQVQEVINAINSFQFNIGKLESQKHDILHRMATAQDKVGLLQDMLLKEYGTHDVNVTDGTINWPEEKKEQKDEK